MPNKLMQPLKRGFLPAISRRQFISTAIFAGGAFILESSVPFSFAGGNEPEHFNLNAWLKIGTDGAVTIVVSQAEMGQGISTTLPAVLADELGADWNRVKFVNAPADPNYRNPRINWQFTGNSESTTAFFELMRHMGASAREMLILAAAEKWRVDPSQCRTASSKVLHDVSSRALTFGELAEVASRMQSPKSPRLKPESEWTLIGKAVPRVENPSKVDGSAIFGMDFKLPGMVYAAVRQCPVFGGEVDQIDRNSIQGKLGIIDVVRIPNGVAVVAASYWRAESALDALKVTYKEGKAATTSSKSLQEQYRRAMHGGPWLLVHATGNRDALHHDYPNVPLEKSTTPEPAPAPKPEIYPTQVTAEYESQFMAHATMEPMNCVANVTDDLVEIWAPTQGQELTQLTMAGMFKLPKEKIKIERTLLGGGFGRRLIADFAVQAALISKQVKRPAHVIWSRAEDMQHDVYRPATLHRITAGIDEFGKLKAMAHRLVSPSILQFVYGPAVTETYDPSCLEGLLETHYQIPNIRVDFHLLHIHIPTSVMRTTGYGPNLFALESFVDELAHRKEQDPLDYRRELLGNESRSLAVLNTVAEKSGWNRPAAPGHYRGMAYAEAFRTHTAHVIELSVDRQKKVKIHRITCAADCGTALDPAITTNALEGGIAWGLTCAFKSEITFENGRVQQSNWHDYPVLRMSEMPPVEVHLINSGARPLGGTGEVGPVTVLPALTNAIFAATGERLRSLPLSRHGYSIS